MSEQLRKQITLWLPAMAWMAIIFAFSHQPSSSLPNLGFWDLVVKKGGHMVGYAILALLLNRPLRNARWAFLCAFVYAATDELHQRFIPGRYGTGYDVLIDGAGALLGLWAWQKFRLGQTWSVVRLKFRGVS